MNSSASSSTASIAANNAAERQPFSWLIGAGIVLATFFAYLPTLGAGYIWDDDSYLTENALMKSGGGLWKIWFTTETPQYYPLVFSSFWIEHQLWGLQPAGYHLTNILLHALNALLVWRLAAKLGVPAAWLVGAAFALHPVHVESVAWVTERKNVLSGLFYLLTFHAYLRFDETRQWRPYAAAAVLFVCALLSKTITATLPVGIVFALFYLKRRLTWRDVWPTVPLWIIGAAFGLMTAHLEREKVGAAGAEWGQTPMERAAIIAPSAYAFYAGKVAWPHPLIFIYPRWEIQAADWTAYLPLAGVSAALLIALGGVRRWGWGPLLLLLFSGATLFPALGFLNVYPHRYSFVADHFQYLGSLGFIIVYVAAAVFLLGRLIADERKRKKIGGAVAVGALAICAVLTFRQCFHYKDVVTLWEKTLTANPHAWIAMVNLGNEYVDRNRFEEALPLFERATQYPIARPEAYGSWGQALFRQGRYAAAVEKYQQAVAVRPRDPALLANLGGALLHAERLNEADAALQDALKILDHYAVAWANLARVRAAQRRFGEAVDCADRAARLEPQNAEWFTLRRDLRARHAAAAADAGQYAEALKICQEGLQQFPNDPKLLLRLTWLRAACPDNTIRNGDEAMRLIGQLARTSGADPFFLDVAAMTAAELGDFQQAAAMAQRALQALQQAPQVFQGTAAADYQELREGLQKRLETYRAGQPYRLSPASRPAAPSTP